MRQLLVESARRRSSKKRGGPEAFVTFDEALGQPASCDQDILKLDGALEELYGTFDNNTSSLMAFGTPEAPPPPPQ